jgi:soluble lytic murein transglycosylase-like protein
MSIVGGGAMRFWFESEVAVAARLAGLPAPLVRAVVLTESAGRPSAYRYEPDLWRRYLADKPAWRDQNPDRVSASYGLMQILYVVAHELGFRGEPELLFVPAVGLEWGCTKLAECVAWADRAAPEVDEETRLKSALASYNGGRRGNAPDATPDRNAAYADKVLGRLVPRRMA